jgi:hypothetical protein
VGGTPANGAVCWHWNAHSTAVKAPPVIALAYRMPSSPPAWFEREIGVNEPCGASSLLARLPSGRMF